MLLAFWLSKEPAKYFTRPRGNSGVTPVGLLERYSAQPTKRKNVFFRNSFFPWDNLWGKLRNPA